MDKNLRQFNVLLLTLITYVTKNKSQTILNTKVNIRKSLKKKQKNESTNLPSNISKIMEALISLIESI